MSRNRGRLVRFPLPIIIMPLFLVILTALFTISDQVAIAMGFLFGSLVMASTMGYFGTERVEKKLGGHRWKWPNDSLKFGMYLWGFLMLLSLIQLAELVSNLPALVFDVILYGEIIVCGIAGFYMFLTFVFIVNPKSRPPIKFRSLFLGLELALSDGLVTLLAIWNYPVFQDVYWIGFVMLAPVGIASSVLLWWMDWRKRGSPLITRLTILASMSPWVWFIFGPFLLILHGMRGLL